jgi:hypothetical protein
VAEPRRRAPDRILVLGVVLALLVLLATIAVAVLAYVNPTVPPLVLPTASSR